MARDPDDTLRTLRMLHDVEARMTQAERDYAVSAMVHHGGAWRWTPGKGREYIATMEQWDDRESPSKSTP